MHFSALLRRMSELMSFIDDTAARSQLLLGLYPKFRRRSHKADGWLLAVLEDLCETFNLHPLFLASRFVLLIGSLRCFVRRR